jgi:hypothetical protein
LTLQDDELEAEPQQAAPIITNGHSPERLSNMTTRTKSDCIPTLVAAGIKPTDAQALRRIAMTLHRWFEMQCGTANGECVERDEATNLTYLTYDTGQNGMRGRTRIPDREAAATKRLAKIMKNYPGFTSYVQGDPRGCALFILRPGDLAEGQDIDACYNRGIAVFK